ncbi:signal peptidase II [Cohnella sp. CIP 111063]|uniref:signal peptidase II n=1 Tax=unclassified Cohnella TaxID=2636738 RepID=UPI000B8BC6A9|nr:MULTISPECIES: signal peptidase II [unclassified Cohnella]OXS56269.1 signal peptidase II [Cohnella sp. CIP 111063]PRX67909.1 signal peptidase II [Cohnella sp. SGD-V74]
MPFYIIAFLVVAADQLTKAWVRVHLEVGETLILWGREWTRFENSGMAGSLLQGYGRLFGVIAVLFVLGVLIYRKKGEAQGITMDVALGFLVGGAVGNGVDRLLFGQVTDFIVRSGGILNVADHAIEVGAALTVLTMVARWVRSKITEKG